MKSRLEGAVGVAGDFCGLALLLRFVGIDPLLDDGAAGRKVGLYALVDRGHLHDRDNVSEEALVTAPECRQRRAFHVRHLVLAGSFQRLVDVAQHDLPCAGQLVVDIGLQWRQVMVSRSS